MLLNDVQKKTIQLMHEGESVTFGGVAVGMTKRYEVHRLAEKGFKVGEYELLIRLRSDQVESAEEVILFIEGRI
ncbi:hypothetical protein D3C73_801830 [compost metagenome]